MPKNKKAKKTNGPETFTSKARDRFVALEVALNEVALEQEHNVRVLLSCALAETDAFALGPPGCGKTMLGKAMLGAFPPMYNATKAGFQYTQFSPSTLLRNWLGVPNIGKMMDPEGDGTQELNTKNKLPERSFWIADEVFKATAANHAEGLQCLSDRTFENGGELVDLPMVFTMGISNELPKDDESEAFYDRLAVRLLFKDVEKEENLMKIQDRRSVRKRTPREGEEIKVPSISTKTFDTAQDQCNDIVVPPAIKKILNTLKRTALRNGHRVSTRAFTSGQSLLRTHAFLAGRKVVSRVDVAAMMPHLYVTDPEKVAEKRMEISRLISPAFSKAEKLAASVLEKVATIRAKVTGGERPAYTSISDAEDDLESLLDKVAKMFTETEEKGDPEEAEMIYSVGQELATASEVFDDLIAQHYSVERSSSIR